MTLSRWFPSIGWSKSAFFLKRPCLTTRAAALRPSRARSQTSTPLPLHFVCPRARRSGPPPIPCALHRPPPPATCLLAWLCLVCSTNFPLTHLFQGRWPHLLAAAVSGSIPQCCNHQLAVSLQVQSSAKFVRNVYYQPAAFKRAASLCDSG